MTHHHHIVSYYMHRARIAKRGGSFSRYTSEYYYGQAFLYANF